MAKTPEKSMSSDDNIWAQATRDVTPLKGRVRPEIRKIKLQAPVFKEEIYIPPPKFDATRQHHLKNNPPPHWKLNLRKGKARPEAVLDLHGMSQDRAFIMLRKFIFAAVTRGFRCILVITGKGRVSQGESGFSNQHGVLRTQLPSWLNETELATKVVSYFQANPQHGGDGAFYIILRREC